MFGDGPAGGRRAAWSARRSTRRRALAALEVAKGHRPPVVVTIAPMAMEEMADGSGIVETASGWSRPAGRGGHELLPRARDDAALAEADPRGPCRCHVGALPIPYRTTAEEPTFFNLSDDRASVPSPHGPHLPTALDPLYANRYEIGAFAKEVYDLGINYIGVCCGASPMLVRETAEAVGKSTRPAGSRRTCATTSCTATTSGYPGTSSRSATRPSSQTPNRAHDRSTLPAHRLDGRGTAPSIASL